MKFSRTILEELTKNLRKLQVISEKNCRGLRGNFANIWRGLENLCKGASKPNSILLAIVNFKIPDFL